MRDETKIIKGAGGGGGPPPPPYRAPDTLNSRQFATVQDLIAEGEIEGFASASKEGLTKGTTAYKNASLKDVFVDDTPILNSTASSSDPAVNDFNFQEVKFKSKFGTSNQTAMSGIAAESSSPTGVGVSVVNADGTDSGGITGSVNRQITTTGLSAVVVTLSWPQIQKLKKNGDLVGMTVDYKIQIRHDTGAYEDKIIAAASGRTADLYSRDHRIELSSYTTSIDIRVIRVTKDSTKEEEKNEFKFTSYQEVIDNNSTYENSAYVALRLDSKQFNRVPTRKYRIRGIKVRIPGAGASSSGTPTVDIQTGRIDYPDGYIFNGVMGAAVYTNCPAMCLLDLLTNKRYGLGDHIAPDQSTDVLTYSNLDLFSFVAASKYANTLVPDDLGGQEARFSCNVNIQSPKEAFAAINELSGVMRCMPIWSAGSVTISQDKPTTASYLFNLANVGEGGFAYQGSSLKTRHTVISVSYFNMDSREVDFEVVEDQTAISRLGTIVKQVKAFACTSRGQAARLGRAILFAEQNESETVTFSTSIDAGVVVRPGSVIEINDPVRAGARRGGRVIAATNSTVTIDAKDQTTLPALNDSPTINVILSNGTVEVGEVGDITDGVLTLKNDPEAVSKVNDQGEVVKQANFSSAPNVNSPYLISSTTLQTQLFRVIQIEEQDDINYVITALSYVAGKYDFIEKDEPLPERKVSILNGALPSPASLGVTEQTVIINNLAVSKLIASWQAVPGATQYLVSYKLDDGNAVSQVVFSTDFELFNSVQGTYTFNVFSYNAGLVLSTNATEATFNAVGKTGRPDNVTGLTIEPINEQLLRLRFNQSTSLDVLHGGRVYVRHTTLAESTATFQSAQDIVQAVPGNATDVICPALPGTYVLKFQDDTGNFSETAAKVTSTVVNILDSITIKTDREDSDSTPYNGVKAFVSVDATKGGLILTNPANNSIGNYHFVESLDLGATFSINIQKHIQAAGYYSGVNFDDRTDLIDTWESFDGTEAPNSNVNLEVATTTSDPAQTFTAKYILSGLGNKGLIAVQTTDASGNPTAHNLLAGDTIFLTITDGLGTTFPDMNRDYVVYEVVNSTSFSLLSDNQFNVTSNVFNCTVSNKFKQFNEVSSGVVKGRGFRFKNTLSTTDVAQNVVLTQSGYTATLPSRTETSTEKTPSTSGVITSSASATTVQFVSSFFVGTSGLGNADNFKPAVTITPQNMTTGDFYEISGISGTQFIVHFKDSNNASISRNFTYTAVGFGKGG